MPAAPQVITRRSVLIAAGLIFIGSAGIQTSSAVSAGLFDSYGPFGTSALRMMIAALILLAMVRPRLRGRSRSEWLGIAVYGVAMALMNLCLYSAIERLPLGVAVTLDFLGPCAVALAASRRWREGLCAVASLLGVALISVGPWGYFDLVGYAAGLGAAFFFGLYTVFASRVGKAGNGLDGLALSVAVAGLFTLPLGVPHAASVSASEWGLLALSAVIGVVIPYSVDTLAGRLTSAPVIGTLFAIDPAMGSLVGWLMLGQTMSAVALCGVFVVMLSGALLVWLSEKESPGAA
ncbi:EamA family transporter [Corynebacterium oculi]|uniref:Threonine/homoserine exporter RhtA n=1 Tax=Corynebacterium oculi TaxID=1544416 RepID=A0A0Q0U776_9CORY|nr:EamA family transporter [Corynebacterium oculi]KQB83219.1 Threonine/homoserine exporter RhtA [Corynebacterium oculi]